jgi:hypothetical protein
MHQVKDAITLYIIGERLFPFFIPELIPTTFSELLFP